MLKSFSLCEHSSLPLIKISKARPCFSLWNIPIASRAVCSVSCNCDFFFCRLEKREEEKMIVTWKRRTWEPRAARTVMGCGRERMDTSAFSSKMETLPGALSPEEEFSQWDINPVSSRLLPGTGQLYVYYSKMQIIFLRNVGRWKTDDGRTATKSFILRNYSACAWHSASSRS